MCAYVRFYVITIKSKISYFLKNAVQNNAFIRQTHPSSYSIHQISSLNPPSKTWKRKIIPLFPKKMGASIIISTFRTFYITIKSYICINSMIHHEKIHNSLTPQFCTPRLKKIKKTYTYSSLFYIKDSHLTTLTHPDSNYTKFSAK